MAELVCKPTSECRQYCLALDALTGNAFADAEECSWAEQLESREVQAETLNPELVAALGAKVRVLSEKRGLRVENALAVEDSLSGVYQARMAGWRAKADAVRDGRTLTDLEVSHYAQGVNTAKEALRRIGNDNRHNIVTHAQAMRDKATRSEHGLIFDASTTAVVDRLVDNNSHSTHSLLVGDKGIAKTRLALFSSGIFSGDNQSALISGHGGMMVDELVGGIGLKNGDTVFDESELIACIREGRPFIFDEVNLPDQQVVMRIQEIMLKRPGQVVSFRQERGPDVVMAPGFCFIATANEVSARYSTREKLDPAFRDRFDVIKVGYPDLDTDHLTQYPATNMRLALTHTITADGLTNPYVSTSDAILVARVAHATQRLYALPARDAKTGSTQSTTELIDLDEPLLTDCITPRKMDSMLERVARGSLHGATVKDELNKAIAALDQYGDHNQRHVRAVLDLLETKQDKEDNKKRK